MTSSISGTFDPCPPVREAVYEVVGEWLVTLLDRYSYFHKLLPIVMTGIQDEVNIERGRARVK